MGAEVGDQAPPGCLTGPTEPDPVGGRALVLSLFHKTIFQNSFIKRHRKFTHLKDIFTQVSDIHNPILEYFITYRETLYPLAFMPYPPSSRFPKSWATSNLLLFLF